MRVSRGRIWIAVVGYACAFLLLSGGRAAAQSIQSAGFVNPAVVEVVFPYMVFGDTPTGRLVSQIVIVNTSLTAADVRVDLFDSRGLTPELRVARGDPTPGRDPEFNTLSFAYRTRVPAGDVVTFSYPSEPSYSTLLDPAFTGWAILRSTVPITAYQQIQVLNPGNLRMTSETVVFGNAKPVLEAEVPVTLNDSLKNARGTGASVVNPSEIKEIALQVDLLDGRRAVVESRLGHLAPKSQTTFTAGSLFGRGSAGGGWFLRVKALDPRDRFAFLALDYLISDAPFSPRLDVIYLPRLTLRHPLTGEPFVRIQQSDQSWDFPVPITSTARVRDLQIFATHLAFFLLADDGTRLGPFPSSALTFQPQILVDEQNGIAVVSGRGESNLLDRPIVFARQRKVVYEPMHGEAFQSVRIPERGLVEITTRGTISAGLTAAVSTWLLLDTERAEVVDRYQGGAGSVPPWRR